MDELTAAQHRLLEEVLVGERTIDDRAVVEESERDPRFAERLREFAATEQSLTAALDERDAVLNEAASAEPTAGEDELVANALRAEHTSTTRPSRPTFALLVAAASALIALGLWFGLSGDGDDPRDDGPVLLGDSEPLRILHPAGPVGSFGRFEWNGSLPDGGAFRIRVWNDDRWQPGSPAPSRTPDLSAVVEDRTWTPTRAQAALLDDRIVVEISSEDADGRLREADCRAASR